VHGDARSAEARGGHDDELYVGGDAEEGEDKGGVFEFVGEEMRKRGMGGSILVWFDEHWRFWEWVDYQKRERE
jgi:hypothetical protein